MIRKIVVVKLHRSICCAIDGKRGPFRFRQSASPHYRPATERGAGAFPGMSHSRPHNARKAEVHLH